MGFGDPGRLREYYRCANLHTDKVSMGFGDPGRLRECPVSQKIDELGLNGVR